MKADRQAGRIPVERKGWHFIDSLLSLGAMHNKGNRQPNDGQERHGGKRTRMRVEIIYRQAGVGKEPNAGRQAAGVGQKRTRRDYSERVHR